MAEGKLEELKEQINGRVAELQKAQKQLQRPSTVSFAERQSLSARAGKSAAELREHLASLEGKAEGEEGVAELIAEVEAALTRAEGVLGKATDGGGRGAKQTGARTLGHATRGSVGASQQRGPDRKGGD